MNSSVYVFGCLGDGYTQYPDDYAEKIHKDFYAKSTAMSQIIIHRNTNLMYYGYIRKLDKDSRYIGFCVLLNGVMFSQTGKLFPIFEHAVTELVERGEVLKFNEKGDITSGTDCLIEKQQEVERIMSIIRNDIAEMEYEQLPPVNFGISNDEIKRFSVADKNSEIVDAAAKYGFVCIYKSKDYDTPLLFGYRNIIKELYERNNTLSNDYKKLKGEYDILSKRKKQYRNVVILCILIVVCGVGLFVLNNSLENVRGNLADTKNVLMGTKNELTGIKNELTTTQNDVKRKSDTIKKLNEQIVVMQTSLSEEQSKREKAENDFSELKNSYENYMPVIITDVELANVYSNGAIETNYGSRLYSSSSMYIRPKITYKGVKTGGNITLKIKFYTPTGLSKGSSASSPSDCSWAESFYVYSGTNTQTFLGWGDSSKGKWGKGDYRYEFWYNNVCLKSKTFTIY